MKSGIEKFAVMVYNYCGLDYRNNTHTVDYKMVARLEQLNMNTYYSYIDYIDQHPQEWKIVVERLTINETYFNREDKQFEVLTKLLQTDRLLMNNDSIQIWSAACSSGEEPYSILMNLAEYGYNLQRFQVLGTDINEKVLANAREAKYNKRSLSFRRIPNQWKIKYFNEQPHEFIVKDNIKNQVHFEQANLIELNMQYLHQKDIIFCRNVLIYFDEVTIEKIARMFYKSLKPGGYLFLGHAETISKFNIGFETINSNGTFYYRKA